MLKTKTFYKKTLNDVPLEGKTVLLRADYNVPLNSDGSIADDYRLKQSLPTLKYLLSRRCKIVICAHLGRPEGKINQKFTLAPVADRLSNLLNKPVHFINSTIGDLVQITTKKMPPESIVLLENLRFHIGEEANDTNFAKLLARDSNAEYFVQDGFGVVHRSHASTSTITHYLPSVAGALLEREYMTITRAMNHPEHPLIAILGGAKVSDKIKIIERFVDIADTLIIGGAMANTFLKYKGCAIGKSLFEDNVDDVIDRIYMRAETKLKGARPIDEFIMLPVDVAVAPSPDDDSLRRYTVDVANVHDDEYILDIGPATIELATKKINDAATVIWNGTVGLAEKQQYSYGSARIALQLASQRPRTVSIIGGGDTADFVLNWDGARGASFSHISTGGGASLELMAGDPMPGIDALLDA